MCTTFNVAQEIFFLKEGEKLLQPVTTSYNALQEVTKSPWLTVAQKSFFFSKGGISCYNLLQQFTIGFKKLQKQRNSSTV